MTGEVIKSFLVGLGFGVDDASLAKFNKAIQSAALRVTALYASIKLAASGIFYSIAHISQGFEDMGYELRLVAPAVNKMLLLRQAMISAYRAAGMDITKVVKQSILFNFSLAKTKFALEAVYKSVGAKFLPLLTRQMDIFRLKIFANMPKIQGALESFVKFIFKAFEATTILGGRVWSVLERVWNFFKMLDTATEGWSTKILLAVAAWKFLNLSFMATPLGMLLTGFMALIALWDDFKTFKEGGESLINWGSDTTKIMVGLAAAISAVAAAWIVARGAMTVYSAAVKAYGIIQAGVDAIMLANPIGLIVVGIVGLTAALTALDAKWQIFGGRLSGFFGSIGSKIMDFAGGDAGKSVASTFGGPNAAPALGAVMQPTPLRSGAGGGNSQIKQENNTNIYGVPDAQSVGRTMNAVNEKNNFDLVRNTRGATR